MKNRGYTSWLNKLERFLRETLGQKIDRQSIKQTPHAVQFKYDGKIEVDLLVSPFWDSHYDLYEFLQTIPESKRFRLVKQGPYSEC